MNLGDISKTLISLCEEISPKILEIYNSNNLDIETKSDNSPVTKADKMVDTFLRERLSFLFPSVGFLTEESTDDLIRLNEEYIWIIDPIDGTKDFIAHTDQFSINIALCHKHEIVLGVIYSPVFKKCWYAFKNDGAYYLRDNITTKIHTSKRNEMLRVLTSNFHMNDAEREMIKRYESHFEKVFPYGSSLKGCMIAMGEGELSYRFSSGTKEWDTAAMGLIVKEAGGVLLDRDGKEIIYNKIDVYNHDGYIICNSYENFIKYSK